LDDPAVDFCQTCTIAELKTSGHCRLCCETCVAGQPCAVHEFLESSFWLYKYEAYCHATRCGEHPRPTQFDEVPGGTSYEVQGRVFFRCIHLIPFDSDPVCRFCTS
jgi:hypothetical protein